MARRSYKSGDSLSKWYYRGYEKAYHESYHVGYDVGYASKYDTEYANGTTLAATEGARNATNSFNSMNNYNLKGDMEPYNVLRFTAREKSTVGFTNNGENTPTMYWRKNGGKNGVDWAGYSDDISFDLNAGEYVEVYGDNIDGFSKSDSVYTKFNITGAVECTGKVSALISGWIDTFEIPNDYCFLRLFYGCRGLLTAPELPATTLASGCYRYMFQECTALTDAPELPATTLASGCYSNMFFGCSSLTSAPELPATTLVNSCYQYMFQSCRSLTSAPELPATTLANNCYDQMFNGCTSLTTAPELPATTLANYCYYSMFQGCSSLTTAPVLPAETLTYGCYSSMFYNCKKLQFVTTYATTWNTSYASNWLNGAGTEAFNPTVFCPSESDIPSDSVSGIPTVWQRSEIGSDTVVPEEYLEDYNLGLADGSAVGESDGEAQGRASGTSAGSMNGYYDNIKIHFYTNLVGYSESLSKSGRITGIVRRLAFSAPSTGAELYIVNYRYNDVILFYSFDGNTWRRVIFSGNIEDDSFTITNNKSTTTYLMGFNIGSLNKSSSTYINIKSNSRTTITSIGDTGDINALKLGINIGGYIRATRAYDFYGLFKGNTTLLTAPELPATTLAAYCYQSMFQGCSALTAAPALPATTLANNCYYSMFQGCSALTAAPALPATSLATFCYHSMFYGCSALTAAPALPATSLAIYCYHSMFRGCSGLTAAPALPATSLANYCYDKMFYNCTSLTTAPELPATTLATSCYSQIFYNCTSLTNAPELPATTLVNNCYSYMFQGCTSLTTAPELPATTLTQQCYYWMFRDCTSLTTAPELPATTLVSGCYNQMFYGCSSLSYIKVYATTWNTSYAQYWVYGVSNLKGCEFHKPTSLEIGTGTGQIPQVQGNTSGIPLKWGVVNF